MKPDAEASAGFATSRRTDILRIALIKFEKVFEMWKKVNRLDMIKGDFEACSAATIADLFWFPIWLEYLVQGCFLDLLIRFHNFSSASAPQGLPIMITCIRFFLPRIVCLTMAE